MENISVSGTFGYLTASRTLPVGIKIEDADSDSEIFQFEETTIAEAKIDLNGKLLISTKAEPLIVKISVIPGTHQDRTLAALWSANRFTKKSNSARDEITLMIKHAGGSSYAQRIANKLLKFGTSFSGLNKVIDAATSGITQIYSRGAIIGGPPSFGIANSGRRTAAVYTFAFADVSTMTSEAGLSQLSNAIGSSFNLPSIF